MSVTERELDAAEYVIGSMTDAERRAFEISIETDEQTRQDVAFWERSFGALNASVAPEPTPANLWDRIEAALPDANSTSQPLPMGALASIASQDKTRAAAVASAQVETASVQQPKPPVAPIQNTQRKASTAANDNRVSKLQSSLRRWRFGAVAAGIAALALGAYVANEQTNFYPLPGGQSPTEQVAGGETQGQQFVAVVNANGDQPSLLVNVDVKTGEISVRSLGIDRPADKSLELWYVPEGQTPVSIGLVGEGKIDLKELTAAQGDLLAVSLEPQGGSPTGTATGPVVYTGKLVNLPE